MCQAQKKIPSLEAKEEKHHEACACAFAFAFAHLHDMRGIREGKVCGGGGAVLGHQ